MLKESVMFQFTRLRCLRNACCRRLFTLPIAATTWITTSCGGGGGSSTVSTSDSGKTTYTIGGTVSGLLGTGLVLSDNGGDDLSIRADGSFVFRATLEAGASYSVSVSSEPSNPAQKCTV